MSLFKTKDEIAADFTKFLNALRFLGPFCFDPPFWAERDSWEFGSVLSSFDDTNIRIGCVRDLFFSSSKTIDLNLIEPKGLGGLYVRRCLGHRVNLRSFFGSPRLCVLVARRVVGGRWREAEDSISSDSLASYLYSRHVVGGMLPSEMHTRMVLRSYERVDCATRQYFEALYKNQKVG